MLATSSAAAAPVSVMMFAARPEASAPPPRILFIGRPVLPLGGATQRAFARTDLAVRTATADHGAVREGALTFRFTSESLVRVGEGKARVLIAAVRPSAADVKAFRQSATDDWAMRRETPAGSCGRFASVVVRDRWFEGGVCLADEVRLATLDTSTGQRQRLSTLFGSGVVKSLARQVHARMSTLMPELPSEQALRSELDASFAIWSDGGDRFVTVGVGVADGSGLLELTFEAPEGAPAPGAAA